VFNSRLNRTRSKKRKASTKNNVKKSKNIKSKSPVNKRGRKQKAKSIAVDSNMFRARRTRLKIQSLNKINDLLKGKLTSHIYIN